MLILITTQELGLTFQYSSKRIYMKMLIILKIESEVENFRWGKTLEKYFIPDLISNEYKIQKF